MLTVLALAGALLGQVQGPVKCTVTRVSAQAIVSVQENKPPTLQHALTVTLDVEGLKGTVALSEPEMTHVLDSAGENLIVARKRRPQAIERVMVENMVKMARKMDRGRPPLQVQGVVSRLPARVEKVRGKAECIAAGRVVREKIEPRVMEEAVELVPGVLFQWTKVEEKKGATLYHYEVRVKRSREEGREGLEPVFAGVSLLDADGRKIYESASSEQRVETASEYLHLSRGFHVPASYLKRAAAWEVCVYDGLERVEVTFEAGPLTILTEHVEPRKEPAAVPAE
jgi:hypothetical protein